VNKTPTAFPAQPHHAALPAVSISSVHNCGKAVGKRQYTHFPAPTALPNERFGSRMTIKLLSSTGMRASHTDAISARIVSSCALRRLASALRLDHASRWSGKRCLLNRQIPGCPPPAAQETVFRTRSGSGPADLQKVSENPDSALRCSNAGHTRFSNTSGGTEQFQTAVPTLAVGGPPSATGVFIGYARVSTRDQNLARQIDALTAAGCTRIFADQTPDTNNERPEWLRLLNLARPGNAVVVASLDRLSQSLQDLMSWPPICIAAA